MAHNEGWTDEKPTVPLPGALLISQQRQLTFPCLVGVSGLQA